MISGYNLIGGTLVVRAYKVSDICPIEDGIVSSNVGVNITMYDNYPNENKCHRDLLVFYSVGSRFTDIRVAKWRYYDVTGERKSYYHFDLTTFFNVSISNLPRSYVTRIVALTRFSCRQDFGYYHVSYIF